VPRCKNQNRAITVLPLTAFVVREMGETYLQTGWCTFGGKKMFVQVSVTVMTLFYLEEIWVKLQGAQ
jgi:hypothetical protein